MNIRTLALLALAGSLTFGCRATPLGGAAAGGDLTAMKTLLDAGADPNAGGHFTISPLALAARTGHVDAIELLLARGADPHRGSGVNGWTPLLHALHKGQMPAAIRLAATCTAPSHELDQALFMAAGYAEAEAVQALLARGADPHYAKDGETPLSVATAGAFDIDYAYGSCEAHVATVKALLRAAPDLALTGEAGKKARRAAEQRGCSDLLALVR
ncbi:MAG TPA: ankyrin repeat domain-containing protein [Candidatus Polarisedimenticolaceae bacterium]|nr:ankyrin repeat domain-containing protein [Candidatus Polarisedimenticolaceae bacterium]